jgi:hypothetical protein
VNGLFDGSQRLRSVRRTRKDAASVVGAIVVFLGKIVKEFTCGWRKGIVEYLDVILLLLLLLLRRLKESDTACCGCGALGSRESWSMERTIIKVVPTMDGRETQSRSQEESKAENDSGGCESHDENGTLLEIHSDSGKYSIGT